MGVAIRKILLDDLSRIALQDAIDNGYTCFPLHDRECAACGKRLPLVAFMVSEDEMKNKHYPQVYESQGVLWDTTDLCGVCTWGEAALEDPEEW